MALEPRDPNEIGIEFPKGRKLRTSSSYPRPYRSTGVGRRPLVFFVVGVLLGAGAGALGAGYWLSTRQGTGPPPHELPEGVTVEMRNFAFVPSNMTVTLGTKVTWVNRDQVFHTVTSDLPDASLQSPNVQPGESWTYTFAQNGTYHYHCTPHSTQMMGTVIVGSG